MISSILLLNAKGDIIILRTYKDNVSRHEMQVFCETVVAAKELAEKPMHYLQSGKGGGGCHFLHVTSGEVTVVGTVKDNVNVVLVFKLLYKIVELLKSYFGSPNTPGLTESQICRHFVLIYELLDEILDFGYPQVLEADILKKYITQHANKKGVVDLNDEEQLRKITIQATGNCSWRPEGIKYRKNEVYIDVIESVNVLLSSKGTLLRSDVSGVIMVKCLLSGMPECKFGMNDKLVMPFENNGNLAKSGLGNNNMSGSNSNLREGIVMDDCRFHQCVRLSKYDTERSVTFVPPDGVFELMQYRITENIQCPFKIMPVLQDRGRNRFEILVKLKSLFENNIYATHVVLTIPVPKSTARVNVQSATHGKAKYEEGSSVASSSGNINSAGNVSNHNGGNLVWRIRRFSGGSESILLADVEVSTTEDNPRQNWSKPPISLDFQLPMFTATGLRVRFLRVHEKSNYRPVKWIRYITKAGSYQHRI